MKFYPKTLIIFIAKHLFIFCLPISALAIESSTPSLTQGEKDWLAAHPVIKIAPDPDFLPVEHIDKNGNCLSVEL